jgi:predicted acylesterase/phospholipase RssA
MSDCVGPLKRRGAPPAALSMERLEASSLADLERREAREGSSDFDMLCLSGGGRSGAWGAGVLNGWKDLQPESFPKFDVVTGVSTGALMATHAFLGEKEDIHRIGRAYTQIPADQILEKHSTLRGILGNGLTSLKPLRRTLPSILTTDDIDRVASVTDRSLYIGTVDLDCGDLIVWDMKKIALQRDYCRYWDVVVASCVAPGFTEPWFIDGKMHVDGGTRQQIFMPPLMMTALRHYFRSAVGQRRAAESRGEAVGTVYAIVNGGLGVFPKVVDNSFVRIALRGTEVLMDEAELSALNLLECYATHERPSRRMPDVTDELLQNAGKLNFRISWVPESCRSEAETLDFDIGERQKLYACGYEWARTRPKPIHNWPRHVPPSPVRSKP